jgi:hypothetical protein
VGNFAPKGHARVNPKSPKAFAICDQCGFLYNHNQLRWGMEWRGRTTEKTGFLVCPRCWDVPNPQLKAKVLPADPVPILNPRKDHPDPRVSQTVYTVATLPSASLKGEGFFTFVSDSTVAAGWGTFGEIVHGGGMFEVPVESDGTNWRIA